jgi:plastocyanin
MVGRIIVVDQAAAGGGGAPAAAATTFDIQLQDIQFDTAEITVPANTDITVNLTNTGLGPHTFNIDALNVDSGEIPAGESKSITFNSGAAGTYEFYCAISGHREIGMAGKVIVQ